MGASGCVGFTPGRTSDGHSYSQNATCHSCRGITDGCGTSEGQLGPRSPMWNDASWKTMRHVPRYTADGSGRDGLTAAGGWVLVRLHLRHQRRSYGHQEKDVVRQYVGCQDPFRKCRLQLRRSRRHRRSEPRWRARSIQRKCKWPDGSWKAMEAITSGDFDGDGKGDLTGY